METIKNIYNTLNKILKPFEDWSIGVSILLISFLYTFTIFNRFLMTKPISGLEETTSFIAVAMVFIGAAVCTRDENHIIVNILPIILKNELGRQWLKVVGNFGGILFAIIFAYESLKIAMEAFKHKEMATSIEIPLYIPYLLPVIGMILVLFHYLPLTIRDISDLKRLKSGVKTTKGG